ncbi:glycogen debranching N-terminal domain-containing protein [Microbacterium sp. ZW T5_56]|uniref:glycogen debranching N-terminal domain-containing protein n=1 Tax=Microbacterium sp. ZW T5_56 TaxID=3378081 RepID=UPI0038523D78
MTSPAVPRQPLLDDAIIALHAPTQAWSGRDGDIGDAAIDGIYHGDVRHIGSVRISVSDSRIETISRSSIDAATVEFGSVLRGLDDDGADPKVRLIRRREVGAGVVRERLGLHSHRDVPLSFSVTVELAPEFAPMQDVKAGLAAATPWRADAVAASDANPGRIEVRSSDGHRSFIVEAAGAAATVADAIVLRWDIELDPRAVIEVGWSATLTDDTLVVGAAATAELLIPPADDPRLTRWVQQATQDLAALRLVLPAHPQDAFYAAGAPWFFTLFGRDSIWAARLALATDPAIAASTLRVLARLQGTKTDPATAEQPGKIPHELRSAPLSLPNEGVHLPPLYYGTVDATPLWVCLLADARDAGMPEAEVRDLVPALRAALTWITDFGSGTGSGFLDYVDETGHGLANQGWKDSGDSIQWRDGRLAEGPIALCEVQAYAYEAAVRGAQLLDDLGENGGDELREWAAVLRDRFREAFWVTTPEGRYPAIALDAHGAAVDSLTSNIGHLLGTGILDADEERACAELLLDASMSSGYGIRTLSLGAAGFWPLSYHGGSVWAHDTAVAVHGMLRSGLLAEARQVAGQLVDAAEGFAYRMPELHSGDSRDAVPFATPYPASCRPQAWSAAAAIVCAQAYAAS